jgi:acylphosphatase
MADERYTVRVTITGRVQGVYYRGWTQEQATELKLSGWVRNNRDASVGTLVSGPRKDVEALLEKMKRGPVDARVKAVTIEETSFVAVPDGFSITR